MFAIDELVRHARRILLAVHCSDPSREAESNDWYNNTHVPDILKETDFIHATRYEAVKPQQGYGKFIALFDLMTDNIDRTLKVHEETEAALKASGRISPLLVIVTRGAYKRLSSRHKQVGDGSRTGESTAVH